MLSVSYRSAVVLDDVFNKNSIGKGFSMSFIPPTLSTLHRNDFVCFLMRVMSNIHTEFHSKVKSSSTRILNKLSSIENMNSEDTLLEVGESLSFKLVINVLSESEEKVNKFAQMWAALKWKWIYMQHHMNNLQLLTFNNIWMDSKIVPMILLIFQLEIDFPLEFSFVSPRWVAQQFNSSLESISNEI